MYGNIGMQASSLCNSVRLMTISPNIWSTYVRLNLLRNIRLEEFMKVITNMLDEIYIEALYHGNVDGENSERAKQLICNIIIDLDITPVKRLLKALVLMVPDNKSNTDVIVPTLDLNEPNTAVQIYFQICKDNIFDRVLIDLIVKLMNEPLFNHLRTKRRPQEYTFLLLIW